MLITGIGDTLGVEGGVFFFCVMTLPTVPTTVSLCVRYSFTYWFTVHYVEATPLSLPHDS